MIHNPFTEFLFVVKYAARKIPSPLAFPDAVEANVKEEGLVEGLEGLVV